VCSKYNETADKSISGDSSWCCVKLSHDEQVVREMEISAAVCMSLRGVGDQTNRIRTVLRCITIT
jgi:hypothetical protein